MARQGDDLGALGLIVALFAGLMFWALTDDETGGNNTPRPAMTPAPSMSLLHWEYQGSACADGWPSQSIGRQGACSHHGGVVSVWVDAEGNEARCEVAPPLTAKQRDASIARNGRIVC